MLAELRARAARNHVRTSLIGMGYSPTHTPAVIQRNVLEDPAWYTAYTPYQAEISQGRLEALLNFQTMVTELTGLAVTNASLLDEATAAAEAMAMARRLAKVSSSRFVVHHDTHPQTIAVLRTRAEPVGIDVVVGDVDELDGGCFGALFSLPTSTGAVTDWRAAIERVHAGGGLAIVATDLLACVLTTPPGQLGADIAVGSAQRFGVPMMFGGPHAAFIAAHEDAARALPGRIVGVSTDTAGRPALRLALQTREQHIRREKATSNICTAQVLLANVAGFYAAYHGPAGLRRIAERTHRMASIAADALRAAGLALRHDSWFDTITVDGVDADAVVAAARAADIDVRRVGAHGRRAVVRRDHDARRRGARAAGVRRHAGPGPRRCRAGRSCRTAQRRVPDPVSVRALPHRARDAALPAPPRRCRPGARPDDDPARVVHDEAQRDDARWPRSRGPSSPASTRTPPTTSRRACGRSSADLESWLAEITGYDAVSVQPNAGSQGELAGLLAIRAYHRSRGDDERTVCLIPSSAHGTNAASAVMAGLQVVVVATDASGNIDVDDLRAELATVGDRLAGIMVTYPSTHGVFEESIDEVCDLVHAAGGQVYVDGANLNALVGRRPPGPLRCRRQPPQPAQDVLHPPRRRRARRRPGRRARAPRAVPARRPARARRAGGRPGVGRRVRLGRDPADPVGVHRPDGSRRADASDRRGDCRGELRGDAVAPVTSPCSTPAPRAVSDTSASSTSDRSRRRPA